MATAKSLFASLSCFLLLGLSFIQFLEAAEVTPGSREFTPLGFPLKKPKHDPELGQPQRNGRKAYIAYLGSRAKFHPNVSMASVYNKMLKDIIGSNETVSQYLLHTYGRGFHGCVAMLTDAEAKAMASMKGVVSVFPNRKLQLQTTRSWDFLGMPLNVNRKIANESDMIVGVIDTGVWPESKSFDDEGVGPVPTKWKGTCDTSMNFACNRKLIGARFFRTDGNFSAEDEPSPRDTRGHGTHTASTAAGSSVPTASYFGLAWGTARGGVPSARIAVYKVCWSDGCHAHDILSAFDTAIADGVDILSISLGDPEQAEYFKDPIAIGAFHAMKHGILTSNSAGNYGPQPFTTTSVAPWTLSVAATTMDRKFLTRVKLGNGQAFQGISINPDNLKEQALIYGGDAANSSTFEFSGLCAPGSLDPNLVQGKIVLCDALSSGKGPFQAGASGIIMSNGFTSSMNEPIVFPLPTSYVNLNDGESILKYIRSNRRNKRHSPIGTIFRSIEGNDMTAPVIAQFSSRGPNSLSPGILKPDLSAPGVAILAAWSGLAAPTVEGDERTVAYNFRSGTSMACPHATGVAAYVKTFHPDWSPSSIKSALMTSASPMSSKLTQLQEFAYGAGLINPLKAIDPGLVYDAVEADYINFLCGKGYNDSTIQSITGDDNFTCSHANSDLNYPSISLYTETRSFNATFRRVVTNVCSAVPSTYKAVTSSTDPKRIKVSVVPDALEFTALGDKKSFTVTVSGTIRGANEFASASLVWNDGTHEVRSPIVVHRFSSPEAPAPSPSA